MRPGPFGGRIWAGGAAKAGAKSKTAVKATGNVTHGSETPVTKSAGKASAGRTGRPKGAQVVAESMAQAAGMLGMSKAQLSWAKGEGCEAFRGPRVYLDEFKVWWEENGHRSQDVDGLPPEEILDRRLKLQKLQSLERDEEIRMGKYTLTETVRSALANVAAEQQAALFSLPRELPPKLLGCDAIAMAGLVQASVTRVIEIFRSGTGQWLGGINSALLPEAAAVPEPEFVI